MAKFKVGDIIASSLSSPKVVEEIRLGVAEDFKNHLFGWRGEMCYVTRFVSGERIKSVWGVRAVESDHYLVKPLDI